MWAANPETVGEGEACFGLNWSGKLGESSGELEEGRRGCFEVFEVSFGGCPGRCPYGRVGRRPAKVEPCLAKPCEASVRARERLGAR